MYEYYQAEKLGDRIRFRADALLAKTVAATGCPANDEALVACGISVTYIKAGYKKKGNLMETLGKQFISTEFE